MGRPMDNWSRPQMRLVTALERLLRRLPCRRERRREVADTACGLGRDPGGGAVGPRRRWRCGYGGTVRNCTVPIVRNLSQFAGLERAVADRDGSVGAER